jgi:integrase
MAVYPEKRGAGTLTGFWYADTQSKRYGRNRQRFDTKAAAEAADAYWKATGMVLPGTGQSSAAPTFAEVAKACKAAGGPSGKWLRGRDASMIQRLDYVIEQLGSLPVTAVDRKALEGLAAGLRKRKGTGRHIDKPLSAATVDRYLDAASAVLTYAHMHGHITNKPVAPKTNPASGRIHTLSPDQEDAVCRVLQERGHYVEAKLVRAFIASGLRSGEMFQLKPEQIKTDYIDVHGDQTKTDTSRRVWIDPELAKELRAIIAAGSMPDAFQMLRRFKAACKTCGYDDELCIHSLRHTTATRLLELGIDIAVVQRFLGHRDIKTTLRYAHVSDRMLAEAAKKLTHGGGETAPSSTVALLSDHKKSA